MGKNYAAVASILTGVPSGEPLKLSEECGVFAVYTRSGLAPVIARKGIAALQHRGQEAAGESAWYGSGRIKTHVDVGLVPSVLTDRVVTDFGKSPVAIAHNRYTTSSSGDKRNAQPIPVAYKKYALSLAHNGNLFNTRWYTDVDIKLALPGTSDSNKLAGYILWQRLHSSSWLAAIQSAFTRVQHSGAFSGVVLTNAGDIFAVKDPRGVRPLCLGKLADGWVVASESIALDMVGATYMRECKAGEIVHIRPDGTLNTVFYGLPMFTRRCALEDIYFSRPDSWNGAIRLREGRKRSGVKLSQRMKLKGIHPTVVVPIYDSGAQASKGMAEGFGIPTIDAITTSHYVGRTFIIPGQDNRSASVNGKHHVTPEGIQHQSVVIGDDSLVRGTTAPPIMNDMRQSGAHQAHLGLASPPVVHPCDLGVDMPTSQELIASPFAQKSLVTTERQIAKKIQADTVTYLPIADVASSFDTQPANMCFHCFGGPHPFRTNGVHFRQKLHQVHGPPSLVVFISGSGTNLQKILDGIEGGDIGAQITAVVSSSADAYGVVRARKAGVPTQVFSAKGISHDPAARMTYERQLIAFIKKVRPDLIVLAGWMFLLSDAFLKTMRTLEVTLINLHPALLTREQEKDIWTTRGKIPIIRGAHAIADAYRLDIPISGVTVHQILPANFMDTGPIIMTEEVPKIPHESLSTWEKRVHEAEYRVLPAALKRVIHILSHNIDTSRGDFPW